MKKSIDICTHDIAKLTIPCFWFERPGVFKDRVRRWRDRLPYTDESQQTTLLQLRKFRCSDERVCGETIQDGEHWIKTCLSPGRDPAITMQELWGNAPGEDQICRSKKNYTHSLERYALTLMDSMTIEDVAHHLKMSWHTIKEMDRAHLRKHYGNLPLKHLRFLAVDEIAYKKGHRYKTIVYDLEAKRAVYVGDGRSAESIKPFLQKVRRSKARIEAIATDMWVPYWSTIQDILPDTLIVFDLFHIVKQFGLTLDKIRVSLFNEETELNNRQLIKGTRWLLLKNRENLSDRPRLKDGKSEIDRLEEAFRINEPLAKAYILKESLTNIWKNCHGMTQAKEAFNIWIKDARALKNKHMNKFCDLLLSHRSGILNWHKHQISTGPLEGFNNKIKVLKRSAYGFRDDDYFALRVLALHESRYALLR